MNQRRYSLPRKKILRGKRAFEHLFEHGSSFRAGMLKFIYCLDFPAELAQTSITVGFSAPKRLMRKAVQRNRAKRCMREVYRLHQGILTQPEEDTYVALFVIYLRPESPDFQRLERNMISGLKKLQHKLNEHHS
jgi:ribonuclease P protein component